MAEKALAKLRHFAFHTVLHSFFGTFLHPFWPWLGGAILSAVVALWALLEERGPVAFMAVGFCCAFVVILLASIARQYARSRKRNSGVVPVRLETKKPEQKTQPRPKFVREPAVAAAVPAVKAVTSEVNLSSRESERVRVVLRGLSPEGLLRAEQLLVEGPKSMPMLDRGVMELSQSELIIKLGPGSVFGEFVYALQPTVIDDVKGFLKNHPR